MARWLIVIIIIIIIIIPLLIARPAWACIWDGDTVMEERLAHPDLARAILDRQSPPRDVDRLQRLVAALQREPHRERVSWWNNLAGALLRIGRAEEAVGLLEPVVANFPEDYGIHANLGTAYHLVGRYLEAEREISRDLAINPQGHFGLERYHLALLQYLTRDAGYQMRHLYIDEWTFPFLVVWYEHPSPMGVRLRDPGERLGLLPDGGIEPEPWAQMLAQIRNDRHPAYRQRWDLARDPQFEDGIIYMASRNQGQPVCFEMLGVAALANHDLNLGAAAFERAIEFGSPRAEVLRRWVAAIRTHVAKAQEGRLPRTIAVMVFFACFATFIALAVVLTVRSTRRYARRA